MRVWFFIDGFNFYHSVQDALKAKPGTQMMWLDIRKMCVGHLHMISPDAQLAGIDYFTAIPYFLNSNPDADPASREKVRRHILYVDANKANGINVHLGEIDKNGKRVIECDGSYKYEWREKGTDVLLACKTLERAKDDLYDVAVIVSGDTDYLPLIKILPKMFNKQLGFALPFKRETKGIKKQASFSFCLTPDTYSSFQLSPTVILPSGRRLHCPTEWLAGTPHDNLDKEPS